MEVLKMHRFKVATRSRSFALLAALTAASLAAVSQPALAGAGGPAWMKLRPAASPPARAAQAMAYDRAARDVVVFGGYDAIGYRNDTWTWDGATWTQANPPTVPPVRAAAGIAYNEVTRQLVMFGGYDGSRDLG